MKEKVANRVDTERGTFREKCFLDGRQSGNGGVSGHHTSNRAFFRSIVKGFCYQARSDRSSMLCSLTHMFLSVFVNERNSGILEALSAKGVPYSLFRVYE